MATQTRKAVPAAKQTRPASHANVPAPVKSVVPAAPVVEEMDWDLEAPTVATYTRVASTWDAEANTPASVKALVKAGAERIKYTPTGKVDPVWMVQTCKSSAQAEAVIKAARKYCKATDKTFRGGTLGFQRDGKFVADASGTDFRYSIRPFEARTRKAASK